MLRFGSHVMAFNFMYYFAENSDYILIGRFIGAQPLGLYTRAYTLFSLPLSQIRSPMVAVAVPALSALRDQPARFGLVLPQIGGRAGASDRPDRCLLHPKRRLSS